MNQANNILVILPGPMGDAILATPAIRRLRKTLPKARITYLANPTVMGILAGCTWTDEWLLWDKHSESLMATARRLRSRKFDTIILLANSFRSAAMGYLAGIPNRIGYRRDGRGIFLTHSVPVFRLINRIAPISMIDYYNFIVSKAVECSPSSAEQADNHLQLFTSDKDRHEIDKLFESRQLTGEERIVVMVPGAAFGLSKCWPAERFARLADKLAGAGCRVIISCAHSETELRIARQITSAAKTDIFSLADHPVSLGGLKELIRRCSLMIANDTGPCHIAAAFSVPLVTIFGPTDPRWTATGYNREIRLREDVDCGPCQKPLCRQDHLCMKKISVDKVLAAVEKLAANKDCNQSSHILTDTWYSPFTESFSPLPDGSGLVHKDYKTLLERDGLGSLSDVFAYHGGEFLHKPGLGTRERLRLELSFDKEQKAVFYLKRYQRPCLIERIKNRLGLREAAAVYDFAAGLSLSENGIPIARPIAYGRENSRHSKRRSFVIFEELPYADALERLLPRWSQEKKQYKLLRKKNNLIRDIARLVRSLHGSGFCHRDLYLAHIFLGRDRYNNERLNLIDLQRIFRPRFFKRRWRVKDLAQLYYSSREFFSGADCVRFLREYFQSGRLSVDQKRLAGAVCRKAERIARHDRNRRRRLEANKER